MKRQQREWQCHWQAEQDRGGKKLSFIDNYLIVDFGVLVQTKKKTSNLKNGLICYICVN